MKNLIVTLLLNPKLAIAITVLILIAPMLLQLLIVATACG